MGGDLNALKDWRARIAAGKPWAAHDDLGPMLDGPHRDFQVPRCFHLPKMAATLWTA